MKLDLVFRNQTKSKTFGRSFFVQILRRAGVVAPDKTDGRSYPETHKPIYELSVNLVNPARIHALNKKYRRENTVTDVLSFPVQNKNLSVDGGKRYTEVILGDIFICPAYCTVKAKEQNLSSRNYMTWAAVHGFLHLIGYDHEKSRKDAKKMSALEKRILTAIS